MVVYTESKKAPPTYVDSGKPNVKYTGQKTVESFVENGLSLPTGNDKLNYDQERFLSEVNIQKQPIKREILSMIRMKVLDTDPKTKKRTYREVLVYEELWHGVDWKGSKVAPATNVEGVYQEVELRPKYEDEFGEQRIVGYELARLIDTYTIPFTKAAVEKALKESNTDDKDFVRYIVKFEGPGIPVKTRCGGWTFEEFTGLSYEEMVKLQYRPGGLRSYAEPQKNPLAR